MRRKAFLFTFLVLSLLLAACVRSGGTEGENSYTIYYPAAELRDVPGSRTPTRSRRRSWRSDCWSGFLPTRRMRASAHRCRAGRRF